MVVDGWGASRGCLRARHEANSLCRNHDSCEVVPIIVLNVDGADALRHHTLDILLRTAALGLGPTNLESARMLEQVELSTRNPS